MENNWERKISQPDVILNMRLFQRFLSIQWKSLRSKTSDWTKLPFSTKTHGDIFKNKLFCVSFKNACLSLSLSPSLCFCCDDGWGCLPSALIAAVKPKTELMDLGQGTVISELIWCMFTFVKINRHAKWMLSERGWLKHVLVLSN